MKPLIGTVRLVAASLAARNGEGVVAESFTLTPEQAVLVLTGYARTNPSGCVPVAGSGQLTVCPLIVDGEPYAGISLEDETREGFTIVLGPDDFNRLADQVERTRAILADEVATLKGD